MTVGDMLDRMTSSELSEWQAYHGYGLPREGPSEREAESTKAMFLHHVGNVKKRKARG